jgi:hypothetical protein
MTSSTRMAIGCTPPASASRIADPPWPQVRSHTTHYSAPEIGALIEPLERVCELKSRKSPALAIVRVLRNEAQVILVEREGLERSTPA